MQQYVILLILSLASGWKINSINLALKKPTMQSSTAIYWNAKSHLAVDGNNCSDFFKCKTCTHSVEEDFYPWWRVDLQAGFEIEEVVVTGRNNMQWRLHAAQVRVGYNDDEAYNANPLCKDSITLSDDVQENWRVHCNMNGRYVTIAIPGDKETLTLCEVEVYGKPIAQDTACYYGRGEDYRGAASQTLSGRTCQSWNLQHPHGHSRTPDSYPDAGLKANYCRNPDGTSHPWCYTTDPDTRWEYCFEGPVCHNRHREDGRCGKSFRLASGKAAECNPEDTEGATCCSNYGYCGNTVQHCHCDTCINYSKDNLALGKTAIQSSTDNEGSAHRAIDGIRGRGYATSMSCTHTYGGYNGAGSTNPWWRVDLFNEYAVNKVIVSNREDCCSERLNGFQIRVGMSSSRTWNANLMCGTSNKVIDGKLIYEVHCHGRRGRFVTVTVPGDHNILTLCEVEVYGGIPPKDPCENNSCAPEADCAAEKDSYTCTCQEGYKGDGKTCSKVSECDSEPCHVMARCADTAEGHTCTCRDGYDGDGVSSCSDVNECESGDACDADATCVNKDGTFVCECEEGYTGDGFSCSNIDECATNSHMCLPDVAECYDDEGTYNCECTEGYLGDGTTECKDEDECEYEGMCSYPHSVCVNLPGTFKCVCEEGYEGDHSECERTFDDTESAVVRAMNPVLYGKLGGMAKFLIRVKADHRIAYDRLIWTKLPDTSLSPPPFDHIKTPNYRRTLVIKKILPEDAGEYNLEVLGIEGATVTVQLAIAEPISAVQQNLTATVGGSVRFDLKFNVWPIPTYKLITWNMGEKSLSPPPTPKYATPNNRKQLVVNKIQKTDEGEYTCTLKMLIRGVQVERSYSVFLTVNEKDEL